MFRLRATPTRENPIPKPNLNRNNQTMCAGRYHAFRKAQSSQNSGDNHWQHQNAETADNSGRQSPHTHKQMLDTGHAKHNNPERLVSAAASLRDDS